MKIFNDLNPGDYIYIIDSHFGIVNKIKIKNKENSIQNAVCFEFYDCVPLWFDKNDSIIRDGNTKYMADKELMNKELDKLIKACENIIRITKQNIQKLKEL